MGESDRVGATLGGKYRLKRMLGAGSMGAVYEAEHIEIGKRLAIKLMSDAYAENPEIAARFRREARSASAVESDYIVQIFDFGDEPGLGLYMAIELLEGEDLETRIVREGHLDPGVVTTIGYQVARGLAKAHAAGVIHRDLKPANIFLTTRDDGSLLAKILDFGISKVQDSKITAVGITVGTPQYMSPEQVGALRDIDGRTDVWSLAAVLYEALSGTSAIPDADTPYEIMMSILKGRIPPLRDIAPWVPEQIADVVHGGLVRERERRIPDAATYASYLAAVCPPTSGSHRFSLPEVPAFVLPKFAPDDRRDPISDIPVSIAFDPAQHVVEQEEEEAPQTMRDPAMILRMDQVATPGTVPPPSTLDENVEVFDRSLLVAPKRAKK
jgi:serine/threonine-protein kinase